LFDLTTQNTNNNDSLVDYITIEKWSNSMSGKILWGTSWLDLITTITESTGRPRKLPSWSQTGAVVGLEGGTENVTKLVSKLQQAGVPIAGVWLQDWVGIRHSWDGDRLIWNWEVNSDWYPGKL
jgi:alpha-glucosidase